MANQYSMLVVDDEAVIVEQLSDLFEDEFHVVTAHSGEDALNKFSLESFDLIISDQRMPHMKGTELFKELAKKNPLVRRILLTGYSDLESAKAGINEGHIHRYEEKPVDVDRLRRVVTEELGKYLDEKEASQRARVAEKAVFEKVQAGLAVKQAQDTVAEMKNKCDAAQELEKRLAEALEANVCLQKQVAQFGELQRQHELQLEVLKAEHAKQVEDLKIKNDKLSKMVKAFTE